MWGKEMKAPWDRGCWVGIGHGVCTAAPRGDPALGREHGGVGAAGLGLAAVWLQPCDSGVQTCCRAPREPRAAAAFLLLLPLPPAAVPSSRRAGREEAAWRSLGSPVCRAGAPGRAPRQEPFLDRAGDRSVSRGTAVAEELLGLTVAQGWAWGYATVLGLCREPEQLERVLGSVGSWYARRDMRDPSVPPVMMCSGFTGSQRLGQGNGSSVAGAAALDIFALARSISQPSSCRKLPCP